ncbi:MAG TPA: HAMP domain-containing sensor histidine kinase, partial [Candidatus Omnitrophota bacterium]|nr:HAMP domain-containing sensor histidine kinase [Candidatus Omnitrophota bacterium]
ISVALENIRRKDPGLVFDKPLHSIAVKVHESDQIINNPLFYSRLKPPHFERINLNVILKESLDNLRQRKGKYVSIEKRSLTGGDIFLDADPLQIKEVLANILSNAYDAVGTEKGCISMTVKKINEDVSIIVKDNGVGIEKDKLERVFDPFFSTKAKGTGLGLTVCRQIVQMHGGKIFIHSTPGKGATVTVILPLKKVSLI